MSRVRFKQNGPLAVQQCVCVVSSSSQTTVELVIMYDIPEAYTGS